jgi:hypothetical protein
MLAILPTISTWLSQGSLANQANGTSSSSSTGSSAAQSSTAPSNLQLGDGFTNLISQLNAAGQSSPNTAATASPSKGSVHGHHHGGGGGGAINQLLEQLEELASGGTSATGASGSSSAMGGSTSTSATTGVSSVGTTPSVSAASATNIEATLNQLLQSLKLGTGSTNVAALNSATTAQSASSLAQRLAQQGVGARAGQLLSAVV